MKYISNVKSLELNYIRLISLSFLFVLLCLIATYQASANDNKAELRKEFDTTFYKMLDNPADIDVTMKYANLAVKMEDYEAAIPALERILLFNPNLPKVKQELGVLYFKLDSMDMARTYLEDAKKGKNVPKEVIEKADSYLSRIN